MAGLEPLQRQIYHEKQEVGSMMCAQHALNTLLQGNYFTAADLSSIALKVDQLEASLQESNTGQSTNMDDTGFFSVQVINEALQVWGMRMVHWRSHEMAEFQDKPYAQFGFILNLEQHWFTLRRFGLAEVVEQATLQESEHCHWFNLNSFLDGPEWIGRIYLNMMLKQAEDEGYSVYAVARIDPDAEFPLGYSAADEVAATLPQPKSSSRQRNTLSTTRNNESRPTATQSQPQANFGAQNTIEGFEDEDMELQAALQASITGVDVSPTRFTNHAGSSTRFHAQARQFSQPTNDVPVDESDPVASSMARSKAIMDRMRREQQAALRETYEDEVRGFESPNEWAALQQPGGSHQTQTQESVEGRTHPMAMRKRTRGEDDEDEELRRAIEASRVGIAPQDVVSSDEDEPMEVHTPPSAPAPVVPPVSGQSLADTLNNIPTASGTGASSGARRFADHTGVYDDDDEALQAALKASLEDNPGGTFYATSDPEERPVSRSFVRAQAEQEENERRERLVKEEETKKSKGVTSRIMAQAMDEDEDEEYRDEDDEDDEEGQEKDTKGKGREVEQQESSVDRDEMRRRRLARFGGGGG